MPLKQKRKLNLYWFFLLIIFFLNFNNNIIKIKGYNEKENIPQPTRIQKIKNYFFPSNNNDEKIKHIEEKYQNIPLRLKPIIQYKGNLNKKEVIYLYDTQWRLSEKQYINKNEFYKYHYSKENRLIYKDALHNFKLLDTYEYNDKNQIICVKNYKNKIKTEYKYNKKGQRIEKIIIEDYLTPYETRTVYKYVYNNQNQKTKKIHYANIYIRKTNFLNFFKINIKNCQKINKIDTFYEYNAENQKTKKNNNEGIFFYKYVTYNKHF
ncbi:hypothetical protein ['Camptotheca acuminata' phytoplasma]|uniref:hypothetical protein n=1 Tax='Camptotheca acuminata' phytoplasma TaxID=3239192 RepID=UPI00351A0B1D